MENYDEKQTKFDSIKTKHQNVKKHDLDNTQLE